MTCIFRRQKQTDDESRAKEAVCQQRPGVECENEHLGSWALTWDIVYKCTIQQSRG